MLQYVMKADPNSAVSYWPKMSQYVMTIKMQTENKPVVTGLIENVAVCNESGSKFGR